MRAQALLMLTLVLTGAPAMATDAPQISAATLAERLASTEPPQVVDVRQQHEYEAGHIPGALLAPHDQLTDHLAALATYRDAPLVLYCVSGRRAAMAAQQLQEAGFTRVEIMQDSYSGWRDQGHPVETP